MTRFTWSAAILASLVVPCVASAARAQTPRAPDVVAIPGGEAGVGYDDLQYAPVLRRVLVPAGRTGALALIDPATRDVTTIAGFSGASSYRGGHGQGTTSAAELAGWPGFIVATDRGERALKLVDARAGSGGRITQTVRLSAAPDYVRVVASAHEVWVTEPGRKQVEVLLVDGAGKHPRDTPRLVPVATIPVPDGPESLVIDGSRARAYSHTWKDRSYAIDVANRKIVATWVNGCRGSRGIALDEGRGLLFTGCAEGKVTVVELASRLVVSSAGTGPGVDSIGYAPGAGGAAQAGHLYVPAGGSGELWILAVASGGGLAVLGKTPTAPDAHTVAFDPVSRSLFVGAPARGAVLRIEDRFAGPASPAAPKPSAPPSK